MSYNPFEIAPHENLTELHLIKLIENGVAEGYFIEYKQQPPKPKAIAKSIASLANTYGGWYIIGVTTDANNVATEVRGFSRDEMKDPQMSIRDVCISGISPTPTMRIHIVELISGYIVLAVNVPGGQHTPFICSDGRVYRRSQDSSDPVFETDRLSFDQIVKRGRRNDKMFDAFCSDRRTFCKAEEDGWINIYISPYPDRSIIINDKIDIKWQDKLLLASNNPRSIFDLENGNVNGNLPFNNIMPVGDAVVMRQVNRSNYSMNTISMSIDLTGRAKFHIPVYSKTIDLLDGYEDEITEYIRKNIKINDSQLKYMNVGLIWLNAMLMLSYYSDIINESGFLDEIRFKITTENLWRTVPVIDSEKWIHYVEKYGLPVNMQDSVEFPSSDIGGYIMNGKKQFWIELCISIGEVLGVHSNMFTNGLYDIIHKASNKK